MAKSDFIPSVRRALRLLNSTVETIGRSSDSKETQQQFQNELWLTPKSVEDYDPQEFAELPEPKRNELNAEVEAFRSIAQQVPADTPATEEQIKAARTRLLRIFEIVC